MSSKVMSILEEMTGGKSYRNMVWIMLSGQPLIILKTISYGRK